MGSSISINLISKNKIQYIYCYHGKIIKKTFYSRKMFLNELSILQELGSYSFIIKPYYYKMELNTIFYPYYTFDFFTIMNKKLLPFSKMLKLYLQLLHAVKHLHDLGIEHHDIKLENCLVDSTLKKLYLIDFEFVSKNYKLDRINLKSGTPAYQPPESYFENICPMFSKKDTWSLGIFYFICKYDYFPITDNQQGDYRNFFENEIPKVSRTIKKCFCLYPNERINVQQLIGNVEKELKNQ